MVGEIPVQLVTNTSVFILFIDIRFRLFCFFRNSILSKPGGSQNSAGVAKSFELVMFLGGDGETPEAHFNLEMVAQLVKNLPPMWGTWVHSLGWEDPLEKGKATHSSILAWRIPRTV